MKSNSSEILPLCILLGGLLQGCITTSTEGDSRKTPMAFLPAEYAGEAAVVSRTYRIHPPYWRRIHRDSVAFVVETPSSDSSGLILRYTIRNPETRDSIAGRAYLHGSGSGARIAYLTAQQLGGRAFVFSPFLCDLRLFLVTADWNSDGAKPIVSQRFLMVPNPESLDLHPFVAHFFPDRIGMVLRSRSCDISGSGVPPKVRETVRILLDWKMISKDSADLPGCASDSLIHLRFRTENRIPVESDTGVSPAFASCREAMAADLVFNPTQPIEEDEILCKKSRSVVLDSAEAANARFSLEFLFGSNRLSIDSDVSMTGGNKSFSTLVSGIGYSEHGYYSGITRSNSVEEIMEVK